MREIFVKFLRSSLVAVNISHCEPFLVIYGTCFNNTNLHKAWSQKLVVMNQFSPVHSKFFSIKVSCIYYFIFLNIFSHSNFKKQNGKGYVIATSA